MPPWDAETIARALKAEDFGQVERQASLRRYAAARVGGRADVLLTVRSSEKLGGAAAWLWAQAIAFRVLGGGSNVLVSDAGVREVVVLNKAAEVRFLDRPSGPAVWAESGAGLGSVARRAVERGLSGLEWAGTVPGTVGGAVVGNAGAFGGDIAGSLEAAEILQPARSAESWPAERLAYRYRGSWLKDHPGRAVVLSASVRLQTGDRQACRRRLAGYVEQRKRTQAAGPSWGSMFKNPPGDHAGRLIEAAGLKGVQRGGAQISPVHANFFVNQGGASAAEVWDLIQLARSEVARKFGIELELEIERFGDWSQSEGEAGV
ncbi:MAG: UDP-N-acetylmuramate dehydrogenase [Anaerolineales bacterium]|nr:UDP-N-acetylmuramate dehydrogenase [Anaerolineales bacterium]